MRPITFTAPIRTKSPNGSHGHWSGRVTRTRLERWAIAYAFPAGSRGPLRAFRGTFVVTLERIAPSAGLDSDNNIFAFKATRDQVAMELGLDDNDPRIEWKYAQSKGKWGVRVTIEGKT